LFCLKNFVLQSISSQQHQQQISPTHHSQPAPGIYGREGPSQNAVGMTNNSMDYSSSDAWPEDLSGLSISDDPFATMFTQQFDSPPQQRHHPRQSYPTGRGGGHGTTAVTASTDLYCCPGPPNIGGSDQPMESVHMGSPEPTTWPDPATACSSFGDFPM
uniref:Aryl hydrocarbon receptor nuclear translocator n=1 Tax=Gongylonema pulchrum TaxID=637853 RepID=A0A183DU58_9BILA